MKYRIIVDITYDESTMDSLDPETSLHDNVTRAIENGLLTEGLDPAIVDEYSVRIESL